MRFKLLIGLLCLPTTVFAGLKYQSENLALMDIESIERMVDKNLAAAQRAGGGMAPEDENDTFSGGDAQVDGDPKELIKVSTELVLARPEQNAATSLVLTKIDTASDVAGGMEKILAEITDDALNMLDEDGKDKALLRTQNTYVHILNNMLSEIKPRVEEGDEKYKDIAEQIRDADISFSSAFKSHRLLNSMKNVTNPSKLAATIVGEKKCSWWEFLWC